MTTTLKFDTTQDTLEAAIKLLELSVTNEIVKDKELPTFSEWWQKILFCHRSSLRIATTNSTTLIRFRDYKMVIKPLLNNPSIKRSDIWVGIGKSGLVEAHISISKIRKLAIKQGICKP